ncbi:MAG: MucBP domain-containing protein [Peptoniphilaceae bacterium]
MFGTGVVNAQDLNSLPIDKPAIIEKVSRLEKSNTEASVKETTEAKASVEEVTEVEVPVEKATEAKASVEEATEVEAPVEEATEAKAPVEEATEAEAPAEEATEVAPVEENIKAETLIQKDTEEVVPVQKPLAKTMTSSNSPINLMALNPNDSSEYIVEDSDDWSSIKSAIESNPVIKILSFMTDKTLNITNSINIKNRDFTIKVADGVNVNINAGSSKATSFRVTLNNGKTFKVENNGIMNFNDVARAFYVSGNKDASFELVGMTKEDSIININNNSGYAIAATDSYSGHSLIEKMTINTNSTRDNRESAIYLGNLSSATVFIKDSELNIINNSDQYTSAAFASNANLINIENTVINSSSRAHYNFNTYNNIKTPQDENSKQIINFKNSELNINTPTDSNPNVYNFIKLASVGINSSNTVFNVEDSKITHEVNDFKGEHAGIELEGSKLEVTNGTIDLRSFGLDKARGRNENDVWLSEFIVNDNSKVTIDKFNDLPNGGIEGISNIENDFPNIVINGGSVVLPDKLPSKNGVTTKVVNQFGEELTNFKIPKGNFSGNGIINIPVNPDNPAYEGYDYGLDLNNIHQGIAHIWTPAVNIEFYPSEDDASNATNQLSETIKTPRGASILLVGEKSPEKGRAYWKNLETGEKYFDETKIPKDTKVYIQKTGKVEVVYVDDKGNVIKDPVTDTEETDIGTVYDTKDNKIQTITIDGKEYELVRVEGEEEGKVINDTIVVTYVYKEKIVDPDPIDPVDPTEPIEPDRREPYGPAFIPDVETLNNIVIEENKPVEEEKQAVEDDKVLEKEKPLQNKKEVSKKQLPQTGQESTLITSSIGSIMLGLGALLFRRKNKKK